MLLSSLREVISNQAHEIQTLQKSMKDLTASSKNKDDEVCSIRQPFSVTDLLNVILDYIPEISCRITGKTDHRRRREEEGKRKGAGRPACPFGRTEQ